jgi:hypothetical protein
MQEYHLTPDELIAKAFRIIQSSRRGYYPHGKSEWIAAVNKAYKRDGKIFARYLQDNYKHLYEQGIRIFGDWDDFAERWCSGYSLHYPFDATLLVCYGSGNYVESRLNSIQKAFA